MNSVNTPDIKNLTAEQKRDLLTKLIQRKALKKAVSKSASESVSESKTEQSAPLSFAQERLWFIDQLQPGESVYTIPAVIRLVGALQVETLQRCLNEIVVRHEILRSHITTQDDEPIQKILPQLEIKLEIKDIQLNVDEDLTAQLHPYLTEVVSQPFNLNEAPLLRCRLLKLGDRDHVLVVTIHHIIADYWSLKVLVKEISTLYHAFSQQQSSPLAPLSIQYGDYAAWQRAQVSSHQSQLDFWLTQFANPPAVLQLPTDRPRPALQSFSGRRESFALSPFLSTALKQFSERSQTTLFMTLLAAFQVLLYRYSGQSDILVGSTVSNRDQAETQNLIGLFVNNLVFRAQFKAEQPFTQFLQQVKATALDAYANKDVPFEQVVDALKVERNLSHHALFQVMFILHNTPTSSFKLPELELSALEIDNSSSRFDLSLDMYEGEGTITGVFEYNTDLFNADTIQRLIAYFETLLIGLIEAPETPIGLLPLLNQAELRELDNWNQTTVGLPNLCAHQLIEAQVEQTPDAIALSVDSVLADNVASQALLPEQPWSYKQLNSRANQLARYLLTQGAKSGSRIAIAVTRSAELVLAMLAVLKLGGTYVPLDPTYPKSRLQHVIRDANVSLVLESEASLSGLVLDIDVPLLDLKRQKEDIDQLSTENLSVSVRPEDLAYIIYTSGSTGKPKGVPIQHRSLVNLLHSMAKVPGLTAEDTFLAVTTVAFDIAALELLLPLTVGARLAIASPETVRDSDRLIAQLENDETTVMQATPATWRMLLDTGWKGSETLKIFCGGEALDLPLAQQLLPCCKELWNLYGPTETTIWSSALRIDAASLKEGFVPIGGPIDNTVFYVLDQQQQPVPVGVPGELHIGGLGLSTGYLNRAELTKEKFILRDTTPLYKTDDLVCRHANGILEYLGRLDHQVKLRGFRIELGEIEAVLNNHPDVDRSLVTLHTGENEEPQLVAYCKVKEDGEADSKLNIELADYSSTLCQYLGEQLPSYMLPTACVLLADFPLTPNGKIDRKALPAPKLGHSKNQQSVPLKTQTEQLLANIWADILNLSTVSANDNFFELGGHSLLAARVMSRLQLAFDTTIPLRSLFENPTLSAFAKTIDETTQDYSFEPIQSINRNQPLPLSYAQKRQWVLAQLEPDNPFYNIPAALRLVGDFSLSRLEESLAILCDRHEALRTTFKSINGEPSLEILPTVTPQVSFLDAQKEGLSEQQIKHKLTDEARKPFDLATAPLMRVTVIRIEGSYLEKPCHFVLLVLHHIISDAESVSSLMREVVSVYSQLAKQQNVELSPLSTQYVDYAAWQQSLDTSRQLSYWQTQLSDAPPLLSLPTDYPRPATQSFEGGSYRFALTAQQTDALKQLSRRHNVTLFMTLMAAFQSLLHRYSDTDDVLVGTPISHRPQAALEGVLGMFVNTLVLRGKFSEEITFANILQQVRETALAAYANQDVPFEQLIDALEVPRSWSHAPLFQAMFVWQAAKPADAATVDGLTWSPLLLESHTTKADLTLSMAEESAESDVCLSGKFEYRQDLFKRGTIEMMADAFCTLLDAIARSPEQSICKLPLVSDRQKQQLQQWNDTVREYPTDLCLHQLFEQQVARSPQATALITPTQTLSYEELNSQANQLADQLRALGIQPDSRVAICLDRTANLIVAILAVLKSGGAYVPIDPNYPKDRLTYILEDAQAFAVITQSDYAALVASAPRTITLDSVESTSSQTTNSYPQIDRAQPNNLAYIIYTSGSTGKPKGVAIEHRSPVSLVQWASEVYSPAQLSGVLAATSICFDLSIFEIFVPLSSGGSVILAENALQLQDLPAAEQVTLVNTVPTAIAELVRIQAIPPSATTINLAGEPIPPTLVQQLYALDSVQTVFNLYGPSEDTTYSTFTQLSSGDAVVPIGRPIANTQAYVLDQYKNIVSIGMPGELYLAGDGLSRGYWNRPDLTQERFADGQYKTGDLVRHRPDGQLEFLGRLDSQVKIKGFRVELGEIEAVLLQHPQVERAVVQPWTDEQGNRRLIAYVILGEKSKDLILGQALSMLSATAAELRSHLKRSLPDYMLPAVFVPLSDLPLLPNGKLNRKALPEPFFEKVVEEKSAELSPVEQTLTNIWQTLLGQPVGLHDNFFELGGDSILAIQAIAQAQTAGLHFSPRNLFQHATVSQLAAVAQASDSLVPQAPIVGSVPLTPIQHWFFAQALSQPHHWNQSVLLTVKQALEPDVLARSLQQLVQHHDALRATFSLSDSVWTQTYLKPDTDISLKVIKTESDDIASLITTEATAAQSSLSLEKGPLLKVVYFDLKTTSGSERRLLIICHHLIIDGVSWRILLNDFQSIYQQLSQAPKTQTAQLPPKTISCQHWANQLLTTDFTVELDYWQKNTFAQVAPLPQDFTSGNNLMSTAQTISVSLTASETQKLLKKVPHAYKVKTDELLLTALLLAIAPTLSDPDAPTLKISLEGHGRPSEYNLSRTIGWLTTLYPVLLRVPSTTDLSAAIKAVKETLRAVPNQGIGYSVLRYFASENYSLEADTPIRFNYLGQTDQVFSENEWFTPATESTGPARSPEDLRDVLLEINAIISHHQLTIHWTYSSELHKAETISLWAEAHLNNIRDLVKHCLCAETDGGYSPTDFPQMGLEQGELDDLLASLGGEA
ncbi:non-ribosomal peptide synthetase [cf. Phormidesmis sp. LEGE 11477]|uniref:non-ribosomal peptide synthetase n=1 Tax=cf. Phormidesmis sp. LEGE 11477 TaxID=1828680 RepID=UPI00187E3E3D|nr:non-ribosomal peptide synthetase [cf. Phormidesmis sp. LEGE 11477]MBE9060865.1 amino acid adenylation domain-containing protein [cf. Phormidesmis sp. LEGE 11477]